jgi:putative transposase
MGSYSPLTGYHNRRSIRLKGYDYSRPGAYFLTLCIHPHAQLVLGEITAGATGASPKPGVPTGAFSGPRMELNAFGRIVRDEWERSFTIRHELQMDEYQIMPDHMHAIVRIRSVGGVDRDEMTGEERDFGGPDEGDTPVARTKNVYKFPSEPDRDEPFNGDTPVARTKIHHNLPLESDCSEPLCEDMSVDWTNIISNLPKGAKPRSIGALIAGFKAATIQRINALRNSPGKPVWQRDYYDRIVRDNRALFFIRRYIRNNPYCWIVGRKNIRSSHL